MIKRLENLIKDAFPNCSIKLEDVSHLHQNRAKHSHINIVIVSDFFEKISLVQREKSIRALVLESGLNPHGLSIQALTFTELDQKERSAKRFSCHRKK